MAETVFDSVAVREMSRPMGDFAKKLVLVFPEMEWDLKKAGFTISAIEYISIVLFITMMAFVGSIFVIGIPLLISLGVGKLHFILIASFFTTSLTFLYLLIIPKGKISRRSREIDKDLEYMLKDMRIQLSSGVPLFDTLVSVGKGRYGVCSHIADGIVREVESGRSITDVLDDVGLSSPSDYLRTTLWQIVNAVRSGSNIQTVLDAISNDIRVEKENKIKAYAQELNMWGLIYMMAAVVLPSMGVTLLVIMSSFIGGGFVTEYMFWMILLGLIIFQAFFISYVKNRRPII